MNLRQTMAAAMLASLLALPASGVSAGAVQKRQDKRAAKARDHDSARQAVLRREVLPLPRILSIANASQRGDIIEIELETKQHVLVYDVHVLTGTGAVRELLIDARTGKLIANRPKDD